MSTVSLCALCAVAGCADNSPYHPLAMRSPGPEALARTAQDAKAANGAWPQGQWFESFHDTQLDALIAEACAGNPDIQAVGARLAEAQSQLDQFASGTGLTGGIAAAAYKARMPAVEGAADVNVAGTTVPINLFSDPWVSPASVIAGANYDLDLWGRNRAVTQQLVSARDAARVEEQQARLIITTSLVTLYGRLADEYAKRDLIAAKRHQADQLDEIRRTREARGIDSTYAAQRARIEQATLRMQLQTTDDAITQTQLQIGVLTGEGPERGLALRRPTLANADAAAISVPANLPFDLLGRRPDVVAAKLRVQAATAKIAATRAAFYPNINLSAAGGLASLSLGSLFSSASLFFALGPAVSLPVFDRARLRSQLHGDYAQADEMIALYNKTLDGALAEVARSIATMRNVTALIDAQTQIVAARDRMLTVATERQRRGLVPQADVLALRDMRLDDQLRLLELNGQRRDAHIALIRALGGGFEATANIPSAASPASHANRESHENISDIRRDSRFSSLPCSGQAS
ncbi:efflux transporter outer membrane subunit [Paraburkholderia sprentiae WSM5005]|uniref:Efflux transporter outer membrane subunit n=1 Tax=Paraburkholderia sprentiae WSM5005 TaxID=754502 RepID=A0A1I9YQU7_9BURK|nr:efflux transporter outer membrane subunit [Paraburkholderia sprentiae]APA88571.2 efflux transporter outer membrane subunit [Paraburkholderia sprentiae WSM5005]